MTIGPSTINMYRLQPVQQGGEKKKVRRSAFEPIRKVNRLKSLQTQGRRMVDGVIPSKPRRKKRGGIEEYTGGYESEKALESQMSKVLEHKKMLDFTKWKLFSQLFARHLAKQVQERLEPKTIKIYDKATIRADKRKSLETVRQEAEVLVPNAGKQAKDRISFLINRISAMDPNQFYWNSIGRIVYMNKVVPNSNISELVADAAVTHKEFGRVRRRQQNIPGWEEFKDVIHAAAVPRKQIGNVARYYKVSELVSKQRHMPATEIESGLMSPSVSPVKTRQQRVQSLPGTSTASAAPARPAAVARTPSLLADPFNDDEYEDADESITASGSASGSGRRRVAPPRRRRRRRVSVLKVPTKWISV
jgi:hypothetical protein